MGAGVVMWGPSGLPEGHVSQEILEDARSESGMVKGHQHHSEFYVVTSVGRAEDRREGHRDWLSWSRGLVPPD